MSQYARFIKAKNLDKRMVMDYLLWCLSWRRYEPPQHIHQGQEPG